MPAGPRAPRSALLGFQPADWNPKTEQVEASNGQDTYEAAGAPGEGADSAFNLRSGDTVGAGDSCIIKATCHDGKEGLKEALGSKGVNVLLLNNGYGIAKSKGNAQPSFEGNIMTLSSAVARMHLRGGSPSRL